MPDEVVLIDGSKLRIENNEILSEKMLSHASARRLGKTFNIKSENERKAVSIVGAPKTKTADKIERRTRDRRRSSSDRRRPSTDRRRK